jgi:REP element-mobilizing transposase RayT
MPRDLHPGKAIRLRHYDYRQAGVYFVTICTRDRATFFAEPVLKEIASNTWLAIPQHSIGVRLDELVVMPNHVHGLLALPDVPLVIPAPPAVPANAVGKFVRHMSGLSPRRQSLGAVVRSYKSAVSKACHEAGSAVFAWQDGYYEHVVRTETELARIRQYIRDNPAQWALDHDNPQYRGPTASTTPWND